MAIQADVQSPVQVEKVFKSSKVHIDQWTLRGREGGKGWKGVRGGREGRGRVGKGERRNRRED